jgi:nicotinamidase-related amidase
MVKSGPDKFLNTELENILRSKGVKTVAIVGSAAHGAVLYTAGAAAFRGFQVVVPVDGISADATYAEQYTTSPQPTPFPVSRRVFLRLPVTGAGWIGLVEFVCG